MTAIGKNLGKFKQWTGEKLGKANKTECSDEFLRLEQEADQRKDTFERLYDASEAYLRTLEKKKKGPEDKNKISPILSLANSLVAQGQLLPNESPYGQAMIRFGQAQEQIANNQLDYANNLREAYVNGLGNALNELKELQQLRKKMESRRLDYNAKMNAVQKAKKEKPELEEQMRAAELKFNESADDTYSKMVAISNAEEMYMDQLARFYDLELEYFQKNVQLLTEIRDIFDQSEYSNYYKSTRKSPTLSARGDNAVSRSKSHRTPLPTNFEDQATSFPQPVRNPTFAHLPRSNSETSEDMIPYTYANSAPAKKPSVDRGMKKLVRVLYDFDGGSKDELPIRKGDTITVLDEIDEGWWIGEIVDEYGRRAGMFPSNYVEEVSMGAPSAYGASKRAVGHYTTTLSDPLPNQYEDPSIQGDPRRRLAPLPPEHSPFPRNQTLAHRPPVPYSDRGNAGGNPFEAGGATACHECGCTDYKANVFKQSSCNNCFHIH
ncbi:BAR-domain-containing protein [Basidiobolus meristosporus CBS 931.73]|uniref:BAR-domain-containing protein n=1 Tax=Basidiobolus meristosporus CBS 931.73 TaxID=1314790 RepID=A0A1Y1Z319_9FUNG|nr:BAR-domain-containing protein [Basidiobolus meristosporus CBS 931.73]|eukprot:ORY04327.1 BAR-domain-containing protein [Basidiobolus meristosporus CBS 931.73]